MSSELSELHVLTCLDSNHLDTLVRAAVALHFVLVELNVTHAIVGGVACILHGSKRTTYDLDLVVDVPPLEVRPLKQRIASKDARFRSVGNSLYFDDVPIELLPATAFAWPSTLSTGDGTVTIPIDGVELVVLSPPALLLSKSGRTATGMQSDRPKTVAKFQTDLHDMNFLARMVSVDDVKATLELYLPEKRMRLVGHLASVGKISPAVRHISDGLAV